jgi:hypothetical protein
MTNDFAAGFRAGLEAAAAKCDGLAALNRAYVEHAREPTVVSYKGEHATRLEWHREAALVYADAARSIRTIPVPEKDSP